MSLIAAVAVILVATVALKLLRRQECKAGRHLPVNRWREGLSDEYHRTSRHYRTVAVTVEQRWTECARCGALLERPNEAETDWFNSISQPSEDARLMRKYGVRWERGQVDGPAAWGRTLGFRPGTTGEPTP